MGVVLGIVIEPAASRAGLLGCWALWFWCGDGSAGVVGFPASLGAVLVDGSRFDGVGLVG